jgi:hypothetical protein
MQTHLFHCYQQRLVQIDLVKSDLLGKRCSMLAAMQEVHAMLVVVRRAFWQRQFVALVVKKEPHQKALPCWKKTDTKRRTSNSTATKSIRLQSATLVAVQQLVPSLQMQMCLGDDVIAPPIQSIRNWLTQRSGGFKCVYKMDRN